MMDEAQLRIIKIRNKLNDDLTEKIGFLQADLSVCSGRLYRLIAKIAREGHFKKIMVDFYLLVHEINDEMLNNAVLLLERESQKNDLPHKDLNEREEEEEKIKAHLERCLIAYCSMHYNQISDPKAKIAIKKQKK
jgi:hypothetical protein